MTFNEGDSLSVIDGCYFSDQDFDAVEFELQKFSSNSVFSVEDLDKERMKLKGQLGIVSKKISALILEKAPNYTNEMEDMIAIKDELSNVTSQVSFIRRYLKGCVSETSRCLSLLANERKKSVLRRLERVISSIKVLHEIEYNIHVHIEDGEYSAAIQLSFDAYRMASNYQQYLCVRELVKRLDNVCLDVEKCLDVSLGSLLFTVDVEKCILTCTGYLMLNKVECMANRLVSFAKMAIEKRARIIICSKISRVESDVESCLYDDLCCKVPVDEVCSTLRELGLALCQILINMHSIIRICTEEEERRNLVGGVRCESTLFASASPFFPSVFRSALLLFNSFISCHDFAQMKLDDVLDVFGMASTFSRFGSSHFAYWGDEAKVSLGRQSDTLFAREHRENMEELRVFMEMESFRVCPLPNTFTLFDLREFKFLRARGDSENEHVDGSVSLLPADAANPFVASPRVPSDGEDRCLVDGEPSDDSPALCNTGVNVLRLLGRYMRMMFVLGGCSSLRSLSQLFDYFLYSVVVFFCRDGNEFTPRMPVRLSNVMERIDTDLFHSNQPLSPPTLSPEVDLSSSATLFALSERVVGVSSLEYLARQLEVTRPVIESLRGVDVPLLDDFFVHVASAVGDVRECVIGVVASRALSLPVLLSAVNTTKWDITDIQSEHSTYVDFLLQDVELLQLRLSHMGGISPSLRTIIWDRVACVALHVIVRGYGEVGGRCSNEGRALMQLDIQHLANKLEKISGDKMTNHIQYAEAYVKAFYLPEKNLEQWVLAHPEYTREEVAGLVQAATHISRKTRQRILAST